MRMLEKVAIAISGAPFPTKSSLRKARAAIQAMRETHPSVEKAGLEALAKAGVGSPLYGWAAGNCWKAMIDKALESAE